MLREVAKMAVRIAAPPFVRGRPIATWPGWLGRTLGVKVPQSLRQKKEVGPTGAANINILCGMIERTRNLAGDIADCGVYLGGSTIGMGLYLRERGIKKQIFGFDSFEGFDPKFVHADMELGGVENEDRNESGFSGTSFPFVSRKVARFRLPNVHLVKGFFSESFQTLPSDLKFCFVHLDVNLYESYRVSLEFFYPRMVVGGIVLFDEYNDPPWPGCNKAVDEFLSGVPETLQMVQMNNYQKWYFVKQ